MSAPARKRCLVAYAAPHRQYLFAVELPADACIGAALAAARLVAEDVPVPWDSAPVGIFGELRSRADVPQDGDRIELYRPLRQNPRERRRERAGRAAASVRARRSG